MSEHTPGAKRAAKIIMNGKLRIKTEYGEKSEEGIADLIDRETAAPELLEGCIQVEAFVEWYRQMVMEEQILVGGYALQKRPYAGDYAVVGRIQQAIAKAQGRE